MTVRVNWNQGPAGILQVHRVMLQQPPQCQFDRMRNYDEYKSLSAAEEAMRNRNYRNYRKCRICWDGTTVNL